ncbi:uncharacterized protein LOC110716611 [Chenopodium quinoa]|uniref:uncharacterized protein LOC110716611 n=1 Tax=Chenopodium quinoa TaxID=63459 RepID=UPI000B799FFF|nr:uncharacterized protein LOC110716611 [Chenopodium quinoa]
MIQRFVVRFGGVFAVPEVGFSNKFWGTRHPIMLSERERYADSSIADSSISCRRNWGGILKKIMKKVLVASSGKQTNKRKLKVVVEDEVVDDVEEDLEDINEVSDGSSEDDDYEEEVEEDDPEDELEGGEYVDEVDYLQHTRSERKRKVVEQENTRANNRFIFALIFNQHILNRFRVKSY